MSLLRPRRTHAAPVLAVAFAAVAAAFGSDFLYGVAAGTAVALAAAALATLLTLALLSVLDGPTRVGAALAPTPLGPLLVRPPRVAVGAVGLSLCALVAWLVVAPETNTPVTAAGASLAVTLLYFPAVVLYAGTFALGVVPAVPGAEPTLLVRTIVFVVGPALSALWQLLLASALVRGVAGHLSPDRSEDPEPGRARE